MTTLSETSAPTTGVLSQARESSGDGFAPSVSGVASLTGLIGAVLYLVGALIPGNAPKPDAGVHQVVTYFVSQRASLLTGFALQLIALALLLWFLGYLRTVVSFAGVAAVPAATTMTAAWVVLMTIVAVATLPALALVWSGSAGANPDLAHLAYEMEALGTYALASTAALVSVAAPSIIIWRYRVLPRWLALVGVAAVVANMAELVGLSSRHGAFAAGYADGIGELLWLLWVAAASVCTALGSANRNSAP